MNLLGFGKIITCFRVYSVVLSSSNGEEMTICVCPVCACNRIQVMQYDGIGNK